MDKKCKTYTGVSTHFNNAKYVYDEDSPCATAKGNRWYVRPLRDDDSTTSLGSLFQYLATLSINLMHQYRLGTNVLKNSFATKDPAVLVNKVSTNQQCALAAANAKHILGRKQESRQQAEYPKQHIQCSALKSLTSSHGVPAKFLALEVRGKRPYHKRVDNEEIEIENQLDCPNKARKVSYEHY
ncbi:hypothetical protein QYF61_002384 [Mycteria americana]|uniref:Uncharacterized protein n=1 Tax=Mycteria americana TaxID=33587 RepID=A0AAN7S2B4_MYCAM|nr:hypothetical protein QYF61_002384 [Mycteria americana]